MHRVWNFVLDYSVLLLAGAVTALVWANIDEHSYHHILEYSLWDNPWIGALHGAERELTIHFLVNDIGMAFFFAIAGKEVWEAVALKSGSLRGRPAITPLIATAGGMLGPAGVYLLGAWMVGKFGALANGWAIPTATDIAFSYLVGRVVFGARHPAVLFLLLLAIADDAAGLAIIAVFYPQGDFQAEWLLLSAGAALGAWFLFNRLPRMLDRDRPARPVSSLVRRYLSFWPYLVAGCLSWFGFQNAGLHPVLGLLPVIPAIPHADISFGIFAEDDHRLNHDLLNHMEHGLRVPVEAVLMLFGLANAGVVVSSFGDATWLVLAGLFIGKPIGIWLFGMIAAGPLKFGMPAGMDGKDIFLVGAIAGIGFTVSLFVASVAFPPGADQQAAKMGALISFAMAAVAIGLGRVLRVRRQTFADAAGAGKPR